MDDDLYTHILNIDVCMPIRIYVYIHPHVHITVLECMHAHIQILDIQGGLSHCTMH